MITGTVGVIADALRSGPARPGGSRQSTTLGELHQLHRRLVAHGSSTRMTASARETRLGRGRHAAPSAIATFDRRAVAEPRRSGRVPGLQADAGGVAGDVGPVLVDDRDDPERDPDAARCAGRWGAASRRAISPIGSASAATARSPLGHRVDPGLGEAQPVERARLHAAPPPRPRRRVVGRRASRRRARRGGRRPASRAAFLPRPSTRPPRWPCGLRPTAQLERHGGADMEESVIGRRESASGRSAPERRPSSGGVRPRRPPAAWPAGSETRGRSGRGDPASPAPAPRRPSKPS